MRAPGGIAIALLDHTKHQLVSLSVASARSTPLQIGDTYRVWASVDCFIRFGNATVDAATTDVPLSAGQWEPYSVADEEVYLAAIVSSGTGVLYITRLK